jgi:hypothetical protein
VDWASRTDSALAEVAILLHVIYSCGFAPKRKSTERNEESLMNLKKKFRFILPLLHKKPLEFFVNIAEICVKFWEVVEI